jgi:outer membrane receptor protein involved in Fe transport
LNGTAHDFASAYSFGYTEGLPALVRRTARTYDGTQRTGQGTLLFQSVLGNTAHVYRTGLSFLYDDYREVFRDGRTYSTETPEETFAREHRNRRELVPGAFAEYTYQNSRNLTVVAGLRADRHNLYGWQVTPRLNVKFDATPNTVLRASAGRGFRVANPLADNASMLVSSRELLIGKDLQPERAWNTGGSFTQYFTLLGHQATFVADYYHTEFQNQVVTDAYSAPTLFQIYNLEAGGRSFARSFQTELQLEPLKGLQLKGAYKYLDVQTTYAGELLARPLTPRHRAFANVAYASAYDKWRADFTVQWYGRRPLAHVSGEGHVHGSSDYTLPYSPRFATLNAQLTRGFKRLDVYAGVENLTNYRQPNPIDGADTPFGPNFDAAMNWGPVYGRMTYLGLRYRIE